MINLQKIIGWPNKKIDIQGTVYFCERGYTYSMPNKQKYAATKYIGLFAAPSEIGHE